MVRAVLSLFLLVTKRLYGKEREWSIGQIKTCRKKQHVKIDGKKEMSELICGKAAVAGNYNSTRDNLPGRYRSYIESDLHRSPVLEIQVFCNESEEARLRALNNGKRFRFSIFCDKFL